MTIMDRLSNGTVHNVKGENTIYFHMSRRDIPLITTLICSSIYVIYRYCRKRTYKRVSDLIGNTPLILLKELNGCKIFGKCEFMNLSGSSKDRFVYYALQHMDIQPNSVIKEASMGSTAISLATIVKLFDSHADIYVPSISKDKTSYLKGLGATLEVKQDTSFVDENNFIKACEKSIKDSDIYLNQFENELNWKAHYFVTGPEIYADVPEIDIFVMGLGTGASLRGIAQYLKEKKPSIRIIIADPQGSGLYNKFKFGVLFHQYEQEGTRHRHQKDSIVEGIGQSRLSSMVQELYELNLVDDVVSVTDEQVYATAHELMDLGLFLGPSSAVHYYVCKQIALLHPNSNIVTMLCDKGERYLSTLWDPAYMQHRFDGVWV